MYFWLFKISVVLTLRVLGNPQGLKLLPKTCISAKKCYFAKTLFYKTTDKIPQNGLDCPIIIQFSFGF